MNILEHARANFKRVTAPLAKSDRGLGGRYEIGHDPCIIHGHWHEDGSTFEIRVPAQLREGLLEVLSNLHKLEFKDYVRA